MKTVIVTGGAGFIGSHLCKRLLNEGSNVIVLDNLYTGTLENLKDFDGNPAFQFVNFDIENPLDEILKVLPNGTADCIYNLACPASPVHYQSDEIKTLKTNFLGMLNVLEFAKKINARVLQASTSEVYGDPLEHPQRETYLGNVNPNGIRSCYDEGKRVAESLLYSFNRSHGVDVRAARIFNTYGPNMLENDGRVVSNFIVQAIKGEYITVYGEGAQTRSFCYVDDLVGGIIKTMNGDFIDPINLGNPNERTIKDTATLIKDITGSSSKIIYKDLPKDDPLRRKPDISLAQKELGWNPVVEFEEGLKKTISYFKEKS